MFYTYVLKSVENNKLYVGFNSNLEERIKDHISKSVHTTARIGKVELVFYESFKSEIDARRREKYFKAIKGKRTLKIMLKDSLAPSSRGLGQ